LVKVKNWENRTEFGLDVDVEVLSLGLVDGDLDPAFGEV
jgi:hypothetical protein